jgi:hypothetical protein
MPCSHLLGMQYEQSYTSEMRKIKLQIFLFYICMPLRREELKVQR